jgi:serine/threonine protein kinase
METSQKPFPTEIWLLISTYLSLVDIDSLLYVNRQLNELADEQTILINRYGIVQISKRTSHRAWVFQFPHIYTRDEDLLFMPDGNHPIIRGTVEKVKLSSGADNGLYARKSVIIGGSKKNQDATKPKILQEAKALLRARHIHVLRVFEAYFLIREHDTVFSIIMERAQTNLGFCLNHKKPRKIISQVPRWFGCLIDATAYLHGLGIQHGDIKPSKILVKDGQVFLADFCLSKVGIKRATRIKDYYAPEVEDESDCGPPADIFSLGAVFLEMLITHSYFAKRRYLEKILTIQRDRSYAKSLNRVHQFIQTLEQSYRQNQWCLKVLSCCRKMLREEPDQRLSADELNSAWLSLQSSDLPLVRCTCPISLLSIVQSQGMAILFFYDFHS